MTEPWTLAQERYANLASLHAGAFNGALLTALAPRWRTAVRPDASMFMLLFTRPDETGYEFTERVEVLWEGEDRVRMALVREVPRRSLEQPGGRVIVAGDFTRPENALPAVEALLHQLASPDD